MDKKTRNTQNKEALGKGIRSLLQGINNDLSATEKTLLKDAGPRPAPVNRIPLSDIEPNPSQPRDRKSVV